MPEAPHLQSTAAAPYSHLRIFIQHHKIWTSDLCIGPGLRGSYPTSVEGICRIVDANLREHD